MADVYVTMIEDRHFDPRAEVFTTPEAAIAYAWTIIDERRTPEEFVDSPEDFGELPTSDGDWLFCYVYSIEGDSVWVVKKKLDEVRP